MSETTAVARISRARQLLAEAKSLTDIKAVRDMAVAAVEYARAAKLGGEAIREGEEIKVRAEYLAGQALKAAPKHPPGPPPKIASPGEAISEPPTLAEQGISDKQAMAWQDMAALPEAEFEAEIAERREEQKPITTKALAKKGRAKKQQAATDQKNAPRQRASGPINVQNIHDANLRADFKKWLLEATKIAALSPDRVAEVLSVADAQRAEASLNRFVAWVERFKAVRARGQALRAIGED